MKWLRQGSGGQASNILLVAVAPPTLAHKNIAAADVGESTFGGGSQAASHARAAGMGRLDSQRNG